MIECRSRQVFLLIATTGLRPADGHRIVAMAMIETVEGRPSGWVFDGMLDPQRSVPAAATAVHGLRASHLAGCPTFAELAVRIRAFLRGADLVVFETAWVRSFLRSEFRRAGVPFGGRRRVVDVLSLAEAAYPGGGNSLDGLCTRFAIKPRRSKYRGLLRHVDLLMQVHAALVDRAN